MDLTLLDALLGFALAYSATYVLYCWVHSDDRPQERTRPATARVSASESTRRTSSHPV